MKLYEILIPIAGNDGKRFSRAHHSRWQRAVRESAGGCSIGAVVEGQWIDGGKVYREQMIPVRIAASAQKIRKLALLAKAHYAQLAIMVSTVASEVRFL